VKIKAGAPKSALAGRVGNAVKINVAAPPVEGRANVELIRFLAELADVPKYKVRILMGESSPMKLIEIDDVQSDFLSGSRL